MSFVLVLVFVFVLVLVLARTMSRPFRALAFLSHSFPERCPDPRALPWAVMSRPFRAIHMSFVLVLVLVLEFSFSPAEAQRRREERAVYLLG
jgi:hypothetical protein